MREQSEMHLHNQKKLSRFAYVEFQLPQHSFESQREQTHHSLESQSPITLQNSRDSFHITNIEFHINNPIRQILHEFKNKLKLKGFKCCEIFQNQLYLIRLTKMDKIKKIFMCIEPPKYILSIKTHEFRSVRTVNLRPLNKSSQVSNLANLNSQKQVQQLLNYLASSEKLNKPLTNQQMNELDSEYKQDIYSLDATSNYMFSKMLVDKNYSIGKRIQFIVSQFKDNCQTKQQKFSELVWLNQAINQITDQMLEGFNCSRKELYQILCYCRKSIQNYFYTCLSQQFVETTNKNFEVSLENSVINNQNKKIYFSLKDDLTPKIMEEDFQKYYPKSLKYLNKLSQSEISVQIFNNLHFLIEFIKIETLLHKIQEENKNKFLKWIKSKYYEIILNKVNRIRAAGFLDVYFQHSLKELKLEE